MEALLTIGYLLLAAFACLFFVVMHRAFWARFYRLETAEDEIHRVVCDDGWETRLYRYRGRDELGFRDHPIIVSHGYCANRFNVDFHARASLARYLNRLGFDTWVIELRGCSDATRLPPPGRKQGEVLFEDFVDLDMPAAIRHVLAHTGAGGVHWVGHSMGGMIALAFAQGPGARLLRSVTAIGSPARLQLPGYAHLACSLSWVVGWMRELPLQWPSQILAPFYFRLPFDPMAIRQKNLAKDSVRRAMVNVLSDMPMALTRQMARMQTSGGDIVAAEDDRNFTAGLSRVEVPLLCIAGAADNVAPPRSARLAVERAASERKAWMVLGGEGSEAPAYGHGDLLIGDEAYRHVFPHVAGWVADVAGLTLDEQDVDAVYKAEIEVDRQPLPAVPWVPPPPSAKPVRQPIPAPPTLTRPEKPPASVPEAPLAQERVETQPSPRRPLSDDYGDPWPDLPGIEVADEENEEGDDELVATAETSFAVEPAVREPEIDPHEALPADPGPRMDVGPRAAPLHDEGGHTDDPEPVEPPSSPEKIDNQAARLREVERRVVPERRRLQRPVEEDRRQGERRRGLRRTPPPGWEMTRSDETRRVRPARLHRSPVSGDALAEALRLAASRADAVLAPERQREIPEEEEA